MRIKFKKFSYLLTFFDPKKPQILWFFFLAENLPGRYEKKGHFYPLFSPLFLICPQGILGAFFAGHSSPKKGQKTTICTPKKAHMSTRDSPAFFCRAVSPPKRAQKSPTRGALFALSHILFRRRGADPETRGFSAK
jgi:hypothetical protein